MRILSLVLVLAAAVAAQDDLAALFPSDTFLYVEADAAALERGVRQLDVVRLVSDPQYREFFGPTFRRLGLDPERPADSLLQSLRVREFLAGKFAFGVRGFAVRVRDEQGEEVVLPFSPRKPVDSDLVHRALGLMARQQALGSGLDEGAVDADFLLVADVGPAARALVRELLASLPIRQERVALGPREVTRLVFEDVPEPTVAMLPPVYAELSGERWYLASTLETLGDALENGPRSTLLAEPRFTRARARTTSGERALFAYADLATAAKMAERFVAPFLRAEADRTGLSSLEAAAFGVSLTEGGVRESFGIVLDGDPKGVWRLLDALPGGLRSVEIAPPDAIAVIGAKLDGKLLLERVEELAKELLPGTEDLVRPLLRGAGAQAGVDFEKELVLALGDEVGLILFPPAVALVPVPNFVFGLEVRDAEAFRGLLDRLKQKLLADGAPVRFMDVTLENGAEGFQVFLKAPVAPPVFVFHEGHLFGSSDRALLESVLNEWGKEGAPSLARDGEVFPLVLKGLTGGGRDDLVALGYVDVRALAAIALPTVAAQLQDWIDLQFTPDFAKLAQHLHGAAAAVRRDGDGINVELFTPGGVVMPALAIGIWEEFRYDPGVDLERLKREIAAQDPEAPFFGASLTSEPVVAVGFFDGSPAASGGMQVGDRIEKIGDVAIRDLDDLRRAMLAHKPGESVLVTVARGGEEVRLDVVLGRRGDFVAE